MGANAHRGWGMQVVLLCLPAVHELSLLEALQVGWDRSQAKGVETE